MAIHLLIVIGANADGKAEPAHSEINVHVYGLRGWPGHARLLAGLAVPGALPAKTVAVTFD